MADGKDVTFTPIPARAIGDARFSAIHFRLLGQIALHDRLSQSRGKGAGCWASNKTLAERCGVNYTNLSVALKQLGEWGYVIREPHPVSKKTSVLRVIYDSIADRAQCGRASGAPHPEPLPTGKPSGDERLPTGKTPADMVCPEVFQVTENVELPQNNIFRETGKILRRNVEPYSVETAPLRDDGLRRLRNSNIGGFLAIVERELKQGAHLDKTTRAQLEKIAENFDPLTTEFARASRILDEQ